jgi:predicted acetylornithine/succinylornithine family transaminase
MTGNGAEEEPMYEKVSIGSALTGVYPPMEIVFARGEGMNLYDENERSYLDFLSGIAVNALGHGDEAVRQALRAQIDRLLHVSNLFATRPMLDLAERLAAHSFADSVFFCNSGTEAVEGALKFARRWAHSIGGPGKSEIIAFRGGFHGRTMGSLSVTLKPSIREPFEPLLSRISFASFNDLGSVSELLNPNTAAVVIEPIQGESGVHLADPKFLAGLRELCDMFHAALIFDEVQCGLGRTGHLFAHQSAGVSPDLMALAKPLGGGLPCGAVLANQAITAAMQVGDHGSTFGGNPLACAAGGAVLERVLSDGFLERVRSTGDYLERCLRELAAGHSDRIGDVRGVGLMWGVDLKTPAGPVISRCRDHGLLIGGSGAQTIRLLPPLICEREHVDQALAILERAITASAAATP